MTISNSMKKERMGRKHCGKRRNCSLRAISPFPTVFSKDLYCRHVGHIWERVKKPEEGSFDDIVENAKKVNNRHFLLFPSMFFLFKKKKKSTIIWGKSTNIWGKSTNIWGKSKSVVYKHFQTVIV